MTIAEIVHEIDRRARAHPIGDLQRTRMRLHHLSRRPARTMFTSQTIMDRYAFHAGGRTELQFNVGYETIPQKGRLLRHAVSFNFQRSQSLPDPTILFPKVKRFNNFLLENMAMFADLSMWWWDKEAGRSKNFSPRPINLHRGMSSIYLGRLQRPGKVNYDLILSDFDRLLPLYESVEGSGRPQQKTRSKKEKEKFQFRARELRKALKTTAHKIGQVVDVELLENRLQEALVRSLRAAHGWNNVNPEQGLLDGDRRAADVAVRNGKDIWLYEIKIAPNARLCIRRAIGQLLEYSLWPKHREAKRLIVVGEATLDGDAERYLERLRTKLSLPIEYLPFRLDRHC
jgi:hypothetical protein